MIKSTLLKIEGVHKSFPGVKVLDNINASFNMGEVHALIGENGAGKSTFMNILFGYYHADQGKLIWRGEEIKISSPLEAQKTGIAMIHQENSLIPYLSVMDNIFLGHFPSGGGFVKKNELKRKARKLLQELDIENIREDTIVERLSVAQKQLIEIVKALSTDPKLIMMDEPTAALTSKETETLMKIIRKLRDNGVSIVYVSHRLEEVFSISDKISILRDGNLVATRDVKDIQIDEAVALMVGRELDEQMHSSYVKKSIDEGAEYVLKVEAFTKKNKFSDISFRLKKGEILGFGGLVGAGRSELMEAIFGFEPEDSGKLFFKGDEVKIKSPVHAISMGMAMVPEERKVKGIFGDMSVGGNINISSYRKLKSGALISRKKENNAADSYIKLLNVKTTDRNKLISNLSGGNQQKAILGRWLQTKPEILILDEPTHGIDVGAKAEIYRIIRELSESGISIILISSELPELLLLSDRIAIMQNGRLNGIIEPEDAFTQENVMMYATGQKKNV